MKFFKIVIHTFETIIGAVLLTIPGWQGIGLALLSMGLSGFYSDFQRPKSGGGWRGDNLSVSLSSSEGRKFLFGQTAVGGSLVTWQTWGDNNEYIILLFAIADHLCDSLVGGWWGGRRMTINADGSVQEAYQDGNHNLWVTFYDGDWNQAADSELITQSGGRWTANDVGRGVCYVKVKARYNEKAHPNGLAGLFQFVWEVKGAHLYDRRDDTSVGGSGAQRFSDQSTWTFNDNSAVVLENLLRGVRANTDVYFGLDLGDSDMPFSDHVAAFNECDEPVALKGYGTALTADAVHPTGTLSVGSITGLSGGMTVRIDAGQANEENIVVNSVTAGSPATITLASQTQYDHYNGASVDWAGAGNTEKRYRAAGVISCDTAPRQAIADLLATMAGKMLMTATRWVIRPGVARTSVKTITDADLAINGPYSLDNDTSLEQLVNAIYGRWSDPTQQYSVVSLPPRISSSDETADGGKSDASYDLIYVPSFTQGQRVLEIYRRQGRRQKRPQLGLLPLGDNLAVEAGDIVTWNSSRNGWTFDFEIEQSGVQLADDQFLMPVWDMVETDTDVYGWDPATDQLDIDRPADLSSADPTVNVPTGFTVTADSVTSAAGEVNPALTFKIDAITDPLCVGVHFQWRVQGQPSGAAQVFEETFPVRPTENTAGTQSSYTVTKGAVGGLTYEARVTEILAPEKPTAYTSWTAANAALTQSYVLGADPPSPNLWRLQDWVASGAAAEVTPTFGISNWGFEFTGVGAVTVSGKTFNGYYSLMLQAKTDSGSYTLRIGMRGPGGVAITDVPDQVLTVTATAQRFSWDNIRSNDPNFASATFEIFTNTGDIAAGHKIDVTDLDFVFGTKAPAGFAPCPNDPQGLSLMGAGPLATSGLTPDQVANSLAPIGQNAVVNSEFKAGSTPPTGWVAGINNTGLTLTTSIVSGVARAAKGVISGTPAANTQFDAYSQDATTPQLFLTPCLPGDNIGASARVAYQNCAGVNLYLVFYDGSGNLLSSVKNTGGTGGANVNGDAVDPSTYSLMTMTATAPANARWVQHVCRALCDGTHASPTLWFTEPLVARMPANQTVVPLYSPGPALRDADKTGSNTASAITNQGSLATRNFTYYGAGGLITEDSAGATVATLSNFKTIQGTAAGFTGQGALATQNSLAYGGSYLTGFGTLAPRNFAYFGSSYITEDSGGATQATLSNFKTPLGTAAGITNQTAWATYTTWTPTQIANKTQWFNTTEGKSYDYRTLLYTWSVMGPAGRLSNPLSTGIGSVSVASHSIYVPTASGSTTISVPSSTTSGLSNDTDYTVYYRPAYGTTHVTGSGNAYAFNASPDGYMLIGNVRTPTSGGTYTAPEGYSGTFNGNYDLSCVAADAVLASGAQAGLAAPGDPLTLMTPAGDDVMAGVVSRIRLAEAACVTVVTETGAVLTVSESAPLMTRKGQGYAPHAVRAGDAAPGLPVPVLDEDGALVWDLIETIIPAGRKPVAMITAEGIGVYAASDRPTGRRLFTHNIYAKP